MVVLVLTACPVGLRGHVTRWLLEIAPGVFCGRVSSKVRDELWLRVIEMSKDGRALMVFSRRGDQGMDFRVHRHDWQPVDFDGVRLIRRPEELSGIPSMRPGWSVASRRRRARKVK
ncbi:type I-E CRISPR-associated endoribonuclease Cas2e [Micropruina sp.]|uniref:type I-E CRISPR-associated endoribonuclease Cas2e n=1 Tax=Micropruina sp. TaxID=2737536 RepID=UPI0039E34E27